jgi:hypothetical protein
MTTQTQKSIRFNVSKSTGWRDAFVVSCLAIVLGAFVAQISSTPKHSPGSLPMASVSAIATTNG